MKQELGSFDGEQIRIVSSQLKEEQYYAKTCHEMAHYYLTYLSSLGLIQSILREYKGVNNQTYKYIFKRCDKIQEIVALFYEFCIIKDDEVKQRLYKKLNGITNEVKQIIISLINKVEQNTEVEDYYYLMLTIGWISLSGNFSGMDFKRLMNEKPEKYLETFFRENKISPKKKFEEIIKYCGEQINQGEELSNISDKVIDEFFNEDIKFLNQSINIIPNQKSNSLIIEPEKNVFDLYLSIIVQSNFLKRKDIVDNGVHQIPILSRLDLKYTELNKKDAKKALKDVRRYHQPIFVLLKEYNILKSNKNIEIVTLNNRKGLQVFPYNLESLDSKKDINIVTRIPRALKFDDFHQYLRHFLSTVSNHKELEISNLFILGNELQIKGIIDELVDMYGEECFKYLYKDLEQDVQLISVFELKEFRVVFYSEHALIRDWNEENLSSTKPEEEDNILYSIYCNLLCRTDLFDRV